MSRVRGLRKSLNFTPELVIILSQSAISFLFLPVLISRFSIEAFGIIFLAQSTAGVLQVLIDTGYSNLITAYVPDLERSKQISLLLRVFGILMVQFVAVSILYVCVSRGMNILLSLKEFIYIIPLLSFVGVIKDIMEVYYRMSNQYITVLKIGLMVSILELILKLLLIYSQWSSIGNFLILIIFVRSFCYLGFLWYTLRKVDVRNLFGDIKIDLKYSVNWAVSNIVGRVIAYLDKPIIEANLGVTTLGYFAIASKFISATGQFRSVFKNLWIYEAIKNFPEHAPNTLKNLFRPMFFVNLLVLLALPVYLHFIMKVELFPVYMYYIFLLPIEFLWLWYFHESLAPIVYKYNKNIWSIQGFSGVLYVTALFWVGKLGLVAVYLAKYIQMFVLIIGHKMYRRYLEKMS